jgi:hypothetical protein
MHQTQDVQTLELGARGGRFPPVANDAVAALSHEEGENAAPFDRFRETAKREQGLSNAARSKRS